MSTIALSDDESITLPFNEPFFSMYMINAKGFKFTFDFAEESCLMELTHAHLPLFFGGELLDNVYYLNEDWKEFFHVSLGKLVNHLCEREAIQKVVVSCRGRASLSRATTESILNACAQSASSIELWGIPNAPKYLHPFRKNLKAIPLFDCVMDEDSQILYGELLERDEATYFHCPEVSPLTDRGFKSILNGLRKSRKHSSLEFYRPNLNEVSPKVFAELGNYLVESPTVVSVFLYSPELRNDQIIAFLHSLLRLERRIALNLGDMFLETESVAELLSRLLMDNKLRTLSLWGILDDKVARILAQGLASSKIERLFIYNSSLYFTGLVAHAISVNPNRIQYLSLGSCYDGYLEELLDSFVNSFDFDQAKVDALRFIAEDDDFPEEEANRLISTVIERNQCIKNLTVKFSSCDEVVEAVTNLVLFLAPLLRSDKKLESFCLGGFRMPEEYKYLVVGLYRDNTVWKKMQRWTSSCALNSCETWDTVNFYLGLNQFHRRQIMDPSFPSHLWHEILAKADKNSLDTLWYCIRNKPEIAQWAIATKDDPDNDDGSDKAMTITAPG